MAVHKLFTEAKFHDAEFYQDRAPSDHIHERGHRGRLLRTLADVTYLLDFDPESKTVGDFGCGTGGLLAELGKRKPEAESWGYDLSPQAVAFANQHYGVTAECLDFSRQPVRLPAIAVLTETLEHLVEPAAFLAKLKTAVRWIVATCPLFESKERHYEYHLWAWDAAGFKAMFRDAGYYILCHYAMVGGACQHLIALNESQLKKPLEIMP